MCGPKLTQQQLYLKHWDLRRKTLIKVLLGGGGEFSWVACMPLPCKRAWSIPVSQPSHGKAPKASMRTPVTWSGLADRQKDTSVSVHQGEEGRRNCGEQAQACVQLMRRLP